MNMPRTITEAMAHKHVYGDWRGDSRWWCAVCSQELPQLPFEAGIRRDERRRERERIEAWFREAEVDDASRTLAMYLESRGEE